ncbi:MAG: hypothetical protein AUH30_20645 [Candidatus Rokubacteria bacterium 13_1_40CM_68_15]|nr:MAG: hypothetical protein AUH30_20645 [Candidatus Rokubacteria bacterium 13_1_40CM_68_15]
MRRRSIWIASIVGALVVLAIVVSFFIDEPLRRRVEYEMNQRLHGYSVRIGALNFHPLGFSIDFKNIVVTQDAYPDPPVARVPLLHASVQWRELIRAKLVADFLLNRPVIYFDRRHAIAEVKEGIPPDKRGWQDALQAMYPLKINLFRIRDAEVTYVDQPTQPPLTLKELYVRAENIRNIRSKDRVYPSPLKVSAVVFDRGKLVLDGNADFLAEPHPAFLAKVALDDIALDYFKPVLASFNVAMRHGMLSARGDFEYGPKISAVHLEHVVLRGADLDYVSTKETKTTEKARVKTVAKAADASANRPDLEYRIDRLEIADGKFGWVNEGATPAYKVFITKTDLVLDNLSNHFTAGTAKLRLTGRFMDTGATTVTGAFRSELNGPDFDLNAEIVDADLRAMNDVLRAHGKFDVVSGVFSLYSEVHVKDPWIRGWVKPLFRDVQVYDKDQDRDKRFMQKVYERAVGVAAKVLKNRQRREVATVADISGPLDNPKASTLQVIGRLIENAFFRAILPGFQRDVGKNRA